MPCNATVTGVKGGPLSFRAEREFDSTSFGSEEPSLAESGGKALCVRGAVGTRQVIGTSECT